jgi:adenylosuccinate synthase
LILPSHVALDRAREKSQGANAIGTTGRGIGPAYEDKVARRALRVSRPVSSRALRRQAGRGSRLSQFHPAALFPDAPVDFQQVLESNLALGERLKPLVADVTGHSRAAERRGLATCCSKARKGAMLDVDLGTYPYVTSSTTTAGGAAPGTGLGPRRFHEVLGIVKAYTTRVGAGPFPTELFDEYRRAPVAGRPRIRLGHRAPAPLRLVRCRRAAALHRAHSAAPRCASPSWTCSTGSTPSAFAWATRSTAPSCSRRRCSPSTSALPRRCTRICPGWKESSVGITRYEELPVNARNYLERLQALVGVPIHIISTGPDREQTIVRQHPFA